MARPNIFAYFREVRKIASGPNGESSKHSLGDSCDYHSNRSAHSRSRYNVKVYQEWSMCPRYGAAQPLQSNLFRSFPASRYRTVAERVMDVGASLLRGTYETRGAPLRSSASDVGHFIHCSAPLPLDVSLLRPHLLWIQILNNRHQFTIDGVRLN